MSDIYELPAQTRTIIGKGGSRRLRRLESKVPAIVYGGEKQPTAITLDHNFLVNALENEGFYSHILTLNIDGQKEKVVIKDLLRHPSKPRILHADFLRVSAKTKITMAIPLHFKGSESAPGVKDQNGMVSHLMTEIEVRCLPGDLPEFIAVDISKLNIGDAIHLTEIKVPKGVEIIALLQGEEFDQPVVTITKPHVVIEEPTEVTEEEAPEATSEKAEGEEETKE